MKQILSLLTGCILCCCMACNNEKTAAETKDNSKAEKNLAAVHAVNKAFETGDVSVLDSVVADDFVDHTDRGDKTGKDSLKAAIAWSRADSKDMKATIIKELADDEYAMVWQRYTGTSNGGMGKPGPYDMKSLEVVRFRDGKAVEHWAFTEMQDVMKMMTQMPAPANGAGKEDEKKKSN
ncbi:MAG: ester cyclase [Bacteroidota bacterium]